MAVQIENQGQLQDFLGVLRRRSWQVILPALFLITLGTSFAVIVPKKYVVSTQVELRQASPIFGSGRGSVTTSAREVGNAKFQITALARVKSVVEELEWPEYLALDMREQHEYLRDVKENIEVRVHAKSSDSGSTFVTLKFMDTNAGRAEEFLKALRKAWTDDVIERDRNTLEAKLETERGERGRLKSLLEEKARERTRLMRAHDIPPSYDTSGPFQTEDPVFKRKHDAEAKLGEVELSLSGKTTQLETMRKELEDEEPFIQRKKLIQGTSYGREIESLTSKIEELEAEKAQYREAHPRYGTLEREIAGLKQERDVYERQQRQDEFDVEEIANPERDRIKGVIATLEGEIQFLEAQRTELQSQLDDVSLRCTERQQVYHDLSELDRTLRLTEEAFKTADDRYQETKSQVDVILGPLGDPFTITEEVVPPTKPSEPNPFLLVAFSVFAGLGVGIGLAVLLEYSKSCFRNVSDISRVMVVPVLGAVNTIRTGSERRRVAAQRFVIFFFSFVVIGSLGFVTWAWVYNPDLLTQEVRDGIEDLRSNLG